MKMLEKICSSTFTFLCLASASFSATLDQDIAVNTTLTSAASPYLVAAGIAVKQGVTLTVEPGVVVAFSYNPDNDSENACGLQIDGALVVRGTSEAPVVFTSERADAGPGDWGSIRFTNKAAGATYDSSGKYTGGSILEYVTVEYGGGGKSAAIAADKAAPFINSCLIQFNAAGGISLDNVSAMQISKTVFNANTAVRGGALYARKSSVMVSDSTFTGNTCTNDLLTIEQGGAIYLSLSRASILRSVFSGSSADLGGAIYISIPLLSLSSYTLSGCSFTNNTAREKGGAVFCAGSSISFATVSITDCDFSSNKALGSGGAFYCAGASAFLNLTISGSSFLGNSALQDGSAVYHDSSALSMQDTLIAYNIGNSALFLSGGSIYRCTIANNPAQDGIFITRSLSIHQSNIYGHDRYNLINDSAYSSSATENFWGTTDYYAISAKIYDYYDDYSKGVISFSPPYSSAAPNAPDIPPPVSDARGGNENQRQ